MTKVFIAYRREDAGGYAGRLFDHISQHLGGDNVFMDIDRIRPGQDFADVIADAVGCCDVLLAVIGERWLKCENGEGRRRLEDPQDFVRLEIETAIARKIQVIPVLVGGAQMPGRNDLPEKLHALTRRQALEIGDRTFHRDVDRWIELLGGKSLSRSRRSLHWLWLGSLFTIMIVLVVWWVVSQRGTESSIPGGPGNPNIELTNVPVIGSFDDLTGQVWHVSPGNYRMAIYIYVNGWWTKPTFADPLTDIQANGGWVCDITTGGIDEQATIIAAFLVPVEYAPPMLSGGKTLPTALYENSVASIKVTRVPQ